MERIQKEKELIKKILYYAGLWTGGQINGQSDILEEPGGRAEEA